VKSSEKRNTAVGPQIRQPKTDTGRVGQAAWVFAVLALGLFSATQFAAYQFNYHPALGVSAHGLYPPWMILLWGMQDIGISFPRPAVSG
jgi:type IV secretion system protein VirD4